MSQRGHSWQADIRAFLLDKALHSKPAKTTGRAVYVRRLLALLARHKGMISAILAASLVLNLCGLVVPRLTQAILDKVVPGGSFPLLTQLVLVMAAVTALQIGLTVWRRINLVKMSLELDRILLVEFCAHLLGLPISFFKKGRSGDLVARFDDHQHVRHLFAACVPGAAIDLVMVLVYFVVMFYYSTALALGYAGEVGLTW